MAAGTGGVVGIFTVEIPPALQIGHAHGSRGEKHAQAPANHRAPGIGSNCPEIIHLFQIGDGYGSGKSACCLVGRYRYLVVPGGGWGDRTSSILIAPADLHRGVLPARAVEDAGKHGRLPGRLGGTHRPKTCRDDGLCKKGAVKRCVSAQGVGEITKGCFLHISKGCSFTPEGGGSSWIKKANFRAQKSDGVVAVTG